MIMLSDPNVQTIKVCNLIISQKDFRSMKNILKNLLKKLFGNYKLTEEINNYIKFWLYTKDEFDTVLETCRSW